MSVRIAVVGGGIAGLSAAWALSASNDVVVLESGPDLGAQATGRSAATLSETSGTRVMCALARASRPFLERPEPRFTEHPLTGDRGLLWVGGDGDGPALNAIAAMAATGVAPTARRVDAATACELVPVLRPAAVASGGVWEPDAKSIDVAALLASYASGARARGAVIRRRCEVHSLAAGPGGWTLECSAGDGGPAQVSADVIVNAAGAWGDVVAARAGVAPLGLRPLRRTACLVPAGEARPSWPLVMDVASRYYFEPESGGLLVSPADEHLTDPVDAVAEMEDVAWALDVLNEATTLDVRHVRRSWAGLRTFTEDRDPAVGWDPDAPGFCWAVGQGGAGIKTAPAIAAVVDSIVGDRSWPDELAALDVEPSALAPARFRRRVVRA